MKNANDTDSLIIKPEQPKMVEKAFAIYQQESHGEVKTPLGPRVVRIMKKVGEYKQNVPAEVKSELDKIEEFDSPLLVEGMATVLAQTQYGMMPQQVGFSFGKGVTTLQEAFDRFDEFLGAEIERIQNEQQQQKPQLAKGSAADLKALDRLAQKKFGR